MRPQVFCRLLLAVGSLLAAWGFASVPDPLPPVPDSIMLDKTVRLTQDFNSDGLISARFSPDGQKIAFNGRAIGDPCDALYLMNRDGSERIRLFQGESPVRHPAFAPDGSAICYNSGPSIYEYRITSDSNHRIAVDAEADEGSPAYTIDGHQIMYCSSTGIRLIQRAARVGRNDTAAPVAAPESSAVTRLTANPNDREPAFSPDGRELILISSDTGGRRGIFIVALDSTRRASAARTRIPAPGLIAHPGWSPDGRFLVYDRAGSIFRLARRTNEESRLTPDSIVAAESPAFAPDGKAFVFTRRSANGQDVYLGRLRVVALSGSGDTIPNRGDSGHVPVAKTDSVGTSPGIPVVDRSFYRIVIFAEDQEQAKDFLRRLAGKGYTNPANYVTSPPANRPSLKYNGAPGALVQELVGLVQQYLNVELSPEIEPRLPETSIYINLP